jgi:hypothetical protein
MQITEDQNEWCRSVYWDLPDQGWEDLVRHIDPFLASAIQTVTAEYAKDPVEWLEINHWPDSGAIIVFPAHDGPYGNRGERICFTLSSNYLENEFLRIGEITSVHQQEAAWKELGEKVWGRIGDCLRHGQASRELAEARKVHPFRLAAFDFDFPEGLFHLTDLDEVALSEMQKELARSQRRQRGGEHDPEQKG